MIPESIYPNNSLNLPSIPALIPSDLDNSLGTIEINNKSAGSESVSIKFDSGITSDSLDNLNSKENDAEDAVAEFILGTEKIDSLPDTSATSSEDFNNTEVDLEPILPETQPLKTPTIPDNYSNLYIFLEADYFNVSQSGKAEIESVYYEALSKGELAIFSLEGMDKLKAGSVEFIAEAARRAASNSHLGYVVISEATEEDNFSASAGEKTNSNSGERKKIRTYCMPAGSQFGIMLVPNGTLGEVLANPEIESGKRPLFGPQIIEYLNTPYLEATISEGVSIAEANLLQIIPAKLSKAGSETVEEISIETESSNAEKVVTRDNLEETIQAKSEIVNESSVISNTEIINENEGKSIERLPTELSKAGSEIVEQISQETESSNAEKVVERDNLEETIQAEPEIVNESPVIPTSDILCKESESNCTHVDNKLKHKKNVYLSELSCNISPKDLQFSTQQFYKKGDVFQLTGKVFDLNGVDDIKTLKISISQQMKNGKWKTIEVTELRDFKEDNEWANFYYELPNLEPGKYQVKLIARDEAGAVSNQAINEFTFLSSSETNNLTDNVLFAIDNATNLDSYTDEELAETKQWLVSVQEGESASDLAALVGATNLGETGLIPNTYIFEFPPDIEPTAIINQLESPLQVEYFYPLTWFNLKTYIPPSTFNTNDPLVSEQWHLNNTGQTGGTIGADINGFPALNISLPGNLSQTVSGADINLGIVDDGVQQSHPDILQRYVEELSQNFNIEIQNAPQSLNASQIQIEPRRSDEIGLEIVEDITLDNMQIIIRNKPIDNTSVDSTGEMSIEDLQIRWPTPRSDEDSSSGSSGNNHTTIIGGINYGIEELQVRVRTSRSEEIPGNSQTEISQNLEELQVRWRTPRSDDEKLDPKELEQGNDLVLAMLGFNGLEELQVRRPTSRSDGNSSEKPADPDTNDMAVITVSGSINSLESLQVRQPTRRSEEIDDLTKIDSDEEAAAVIENGLQKVFESWEILSAQDASNEDLQKRVQPKQSDPNAQPLSFFTGTDTASIVSEILKNNPAEMWVYGKPKNGDADSVVLISGKDSAAVADSILKYDLAEISVWWNPAPNPQPIDDISTGFDRVWTGGNADQESVRSGETFVELGTILGRENLEKLWERWNDDNSGSATNQIPNRHGTSVAGVAAASANETGIMGAAYEAGIANVQLLGDNLVTDKQIADALSYQNQAIDVYNNSWKPGDPLVSSPLINWAFENNVNDGRNGLGNITVFAGGNDGWDGGNVNYNSFANSRNTIAVAAIDHNGEQSWYGEPGASLLISAYSSGDGVGITTTATSKDGDAAYTDSFGGTSSSAPLVSGVIALMLQVNPNLTQRDVQHILVETADKNDPNDENWETNAAGYDVNYKYGFGGINAEAAVKAAISWNGVSPEISVESPVQHVGISIPDNNSSGVVSSITIGQDIKVEWAEVMVDIDHSWRGDLEVKLISPNETESILAEPHYDPEDGYKWVFTSNRNWGESSLGDWKLEVSDRLSGEAGVLNNWKLNLYGTEQVIPDNSWTRQLGTNTPEDGQGVVVDNQGNVYLVGSTNGSLDGNINGSGANAVWADPFITKYDDEGNKLWTKQLGSTGYDYYLDPAIDQNNNIYIIGYDDGPGASIGDAKLTKFDSNGNVIWSVLSGFSSHDYARSITTDNVGNVLVTGFAMQPGDGQYNAFVRKYDAQGNIIWNQIISSPETDRARSVVTDAQGNVYVAGITETSTSNNFNAGIDTSKIAVQINGGVNIRSGPGTSNGMVGTISSTDPLVFDSETVGELVIDPNGEGSSNIWYHLADGRGWMSALYVNKLPASPQTLDGQVKIGGSDIFVTKFDAAGNKLWTELLGTPANESAGSYPRNVGLSLDSTGNIYISGITDGAFAGQTNSGGTDGFLAQYNPQGNLNWMRQFGGAGNENTNGIAISASGEIYITGDTNSSLLYGEQNAGGSDIFVVKYDQSGNLLGTELAGTTNADIAYDIAVDRSGNVYLAGTTSGSLDGINAGDRDAWVSKNGLPRFDAEPVINITTTDEDAGEDGNTGTFTMTRTGDTTGTLTVNYAVAGKAKFGSDYLGLTGSVTFDAGVTSIPLNVIPLDDNLDEEDEILEVIVGANSAYKVGTNNIASLTIKDNDDPTITITATDANATEDGNAAQFVVTRTGPDLNNPITVHYSVAGIATNGTDYQKLTGSVTIPAGMSSATIPVNPIFDYNAEGEETVTLNLIDTNYYDLGTSAGATATITNSTTTDWYGPFVYENPDNGHLYILSQFDTWLGAQNQAQILGVNLVTINDAAENNWLINTFGGNQKFWIGLTDSEIYGATEGNFKWVSGESLTYLNWNPTEPNNSIAGWLPEGEDFSEMYQGIAGTWNDAAPNEPQTIFSDRPPQAGIIEIDPTTLTKPIVNFMVTDSQAGENGNAGQLIISRIGKLDEALTVNYTVAGTATNGSDYQPLTGTVTIPAGSSLVTIPILALNDNDVEGNETIVVNLAAGNYQIGNKPVAQVTVADDDSGIFPVNNTPTLNPSASLTNATESAPYIITYETLLSATNAIDTEGDTLTFRIESVGADILTKNGQPVVAGVTTLSPGESLVWTPTTAGTQMPAFSVSVSDGVGANPQWLPVPTPIAIDVFKPVVSITASDPNATEGVDSGEFTITRTGDTTNPLTVNYGIDNNGFWSYPVATNGSDYETLSGTVTIPAGASSVKIPINVIDDNVIEWSERVKLFVAGTDNYQVGNNANAEVKIWDNETPRLELYDDEQLGRYDGVEGGVSARFLVRRVGSLLEPLTVNYSVAGTATPGTDYTGVGLDQSTQTGTITIPAGQYEAYIQFNAIDDTEEETVETIDVTFTPNPNYTILAGYGTGIVNIHDNENKPIFNISTTDFTATEGSDNGQFTITRTGDLSQTVTLKYNVSSDWSNPTTNDGTDYEFVPNSITFDPYQTTATITINPIDDNIAEVTESVVINLLRDAAYMVGDSSVGRFLIYDNERPEVEWKQQLGTTADDTINALAINNGNLSFATNGELIGTGADDNIDIAFDNFGNRYSLSKGESLTYLSKYNSAGGVEWQQSFGVNSEMTKLAVTPDGSVYITGSTTDNLDGINAGKLDAFLAKFDSAGTQEWVKQIGTPDDEKSTAIAIDNQGNVYITGTTKGGLGGTREGDGDAWVAKYNSSGSLQWTEQIGSIAEDISYGIATDNNGHIYVAGKTYGWLGENYTGGPRNWVGDATARYEAIIGNSYGLGGLYYGNGDAWVAQLSTDGELNWKRLLGTTGEDSANSIVADSTGVYLTGTTTGKLGDTQFGGQDIFYAKYNVAGALEWKQQLGTTADDVANDIVLDGTALIIAGETSGNLEGTNEGGKDAFVIKLS